jgi:hypothetical protein
MMAHGKIPKLLDLGRKSSRIPNVLQDDQGHGWICCRSISLCLSAGSHKNADLRDGLSLGLPHWSVLLTLLTY